MRRTGVVSLVTAVVGPMENGRGYTLLRHSAGDREAQAWDGMLRHFSLALGAWADLRAQPFVSMFALDEPGSAFAVARVRFLGDADLGTVAMANVVIAPRTVLEALDWRSHLLLGLVAWPSDEIDPVSFAERSVSVDPQALARGHDVRPVAAFGLEWRDQVVDAAGADPEIVLACALDGMDPPEQRARISGWATTDALARSGAFDPASAFRLIVRPPDAGSRRADASAAPTDVPLAWRAWRIVEQAAQDVGARSGMSWKPIYADRAPESVAAIAILEAAVALGAVDRSALLAEISALAEAAGPLAPVLYAGIGLALARLMEQPDSPEGAAYYLNAYVEANADRHDAVAAVTPLALGPGILGWMSAQSLDLLLFQGLADRLDVFEGARRAELSDLSAETRLRVLKAASIEPIAASRQTVLARLVSQALHEPDARAAAEIALSRLLGTREASPLVELGTGEAWTVAAPQSHLRTAFARRVLSPVVTGAVPVARAAYVEALSLAAAVLTDPVSAHPAVKGTRR